MPALATTPAPTTGTVRVNLPPLRATRRAVKAAPVAPLPIPTPPLTPLERLQQDVKNLAKSRADAADLEGHLYEVRAYDPDTDTVYIQRNDIAANAVYGVNRQTLTCDCPDMGGVVNRAGERIEGIISRTNRRLVEAGLCPCLFCKHVFDGQPARTGRPPTRGKQRLPGWAVNGDGWAEQRRLGLRLPPLSTPTNPRTNWATRFPTPTKWKGFSSDDKTAV